MYPIIFNMYSLGILLLSENTYVLFCAYYMNAFLVYNNTRLNDYFLGNITILKKLITFLSPMHRAAKRRDVLLRNCTLIEDIKVQFIKN